MALLRWDPWGELSALQRDVNELFSRTGPQQARTAGLVPPMDAFRTDEGLVVRVELPGMRPEDVDVSVSDGVLTVAGERVTDQDVKEDGWLRRERAVGSFERSFTLPEGTDASQIAANFEHGVLELRIPHPPERKPHKVQISGGGAWTKTLDVGEGGQS